MEVEGLVNKYNSCIFKSGKSLKQINKLLQSNVDRFLTGVIHEALRYH